MKNNYVLLLVLLTTCFNYGQNVTITRIIDGVSNADCSGGVAGGRPKMLELYVSGTVDFAAVNDNGTPTDASDDKGYNLEVMTNGDVTGTWNKKDISALGEVTDGFVYLIHAAAGSGKAVFEAMYPAGEFLPQAEVSAWLDGNDVVRLTDHNDNVLDQFGDPSDVSAATDYDNPWNYQDRYAARVNGSTASGTFNASDWTFVSTPWASDGSVSCSDMATDISFGTYIPTVLSISKSEIVNIVTYPNPVNSGEFRINTQTLGNPVKQVKIFNAFGELLLNKTSAYNDKPINVSGFKSGLYILRVEEAGKVATQKLIIE